MSHTGLRYMFFRDNMRSMQQLAVWRGLTGFDLFTGRLSYDATSR